MKHLVLPLALLLTACIAWCCSRGEEQADQDVADQATVAEQGSNLVKQGRTLADFEPKLSKSLTYKEVEEAFGKPDRMPGSGLLIYAYDLADGREIWMAFGNEGKVVYARVRAEGKTVQELELE
jgi:hypothetical protein